MHLVVRPAAPADGTWLVGLLDAANRGGKASLICGMLVSDA